MAVKQMDRKGPVPTSVKGPCCTLQDFKCKGSDYISLPSNSTSSFNRFTSQRGDHLRPINESQTLQRESRC